MTGSKSLLTVLNRFGHCISYDEVKRLEAEMAYSCSDTGCETPDGLNLHSNLATGKTNTNLLLVHDVLLLCSVLAWDNYDVTTETLDGKNTLHSMVGISYQN